VSETPDNSPGVPTSDDLLIAAFEKMSSSKKLELMWDFVYSLNQDFSKLNDPVLTREMDVLDGILSNVETRLEEIEAIYGKQW
jgi:hypothetical protein